MTATCDLALLSCGGIDALTTSCRFGYVSEAERQSTIEAGLVGDVLQNFLGRAGQRVDHPLNAHVIGMSPARPSGVENEALVSGGRETPGVPRGALRQVRPQTLVADKITARRLVEGAVRP